MPRFKTTAYKPYVMVIIPILQGSTNVVIVVYQDISTRDMIAPPNKAA